YYYKVRAVNNTAASAATAQVSGVTEADTTAPTSPTNLVVSSRTNQSITLTWTAATDDVGVTGYEVYVNGQFSYVTTNTTFVISPLTYQTNNTFYVKAKDFAGNLSPASNQVTAQPLLTGLEYKTYLGDWTVLPNFPTLSPVATGRVPNVSLQNIMPRDNNYGHTWTGYIKIPVTGQYTFATISDDGSKLYLGSLNSTTNPYNFGASGTVNNDGSHSENMAFSTPMTLTAGYYPIAIAFFENSGGERMEVRWATPQTAGEYPLIPDSVFMEAPLNLGSAPNAPTAPVATAVNYRRINTSWTDASANETGFEVWRSTTAGSGFVTIGRTAANTTSFADSVNVSPATTYYYKFKSLGLNGESAFTSTVSATTPAAPALPNTPGQLLASSNIAKSIRVTWNDNSSNETSFELYRSNNDNANYILLKTLNPNTTSYLDTGLFAHNIYYYKVRAKGISGSTVFSTEDSARAGNNKPVIVQVPNKTVRYGVTTNIVLSASDVDSDPITLTILNRPSFATFTDNGNGTGTLVLNPALVNAGLYSNIRIIATDSYAG
ncbi:MAG: hypothetical protein EOO39_28485, partial [Cytophagaceae bacterium]